MSNLTFFTLLELWNEKKNIYYESLKTEYEIYINTVSQKGMAASLECCIFLVIVYDLIKAEMILDLGSGFSSYALRFFKKFNDNIFSIDTDTKWLNKSYEFCRSKNVDIENFETWNNFKNKDIKFDLIFLDIDNKKPTDRSIYFPFVFEKYSKKETLIICDDLHKKRINSTLKEYLKNKKNLKQHDIRKQTEDEFGRFSTLIEVI